MSAVAPQALPVTCPVEIADDVWVYAQWDGSWWINTTGFIAGPVVLAVDACATEERTQAFIAAIAATTGKRAAMLVNTHAHGDHTFGNCVFDPTTVIAHEKCRDAMLEFADTFPKLSQFALPAYDRLPDWGELTWRFPDVTFGSRLDLWVGELNAQLWHSGHTAHTDNDTVVWIPDRRVLFTGDLIFNGGTPLAVAGSVSGAIATLDWMRGFDAAVLVPGHGQPCGPDQIDFHIRYWRMIQSGAADGHQAGLTPVQTAHELDQGEFAELGDQERVVMNLHRAYAEIDSDHRFDFHSAAADAVAYAGRPIRCIA